MKKKSASFFIATMALSAATLLAQTLAPSPLSDRAELAKVEEWMLSQGTEQSIAPELAAILGLGSDRLPVKVKSYLVANGITRAFAVSTNPDQKGIVVSALKTMTKNTQIYFVGNAWLTDRSGNLRRTIYIDASGARIVSNSSHEAEFKDIKDFFVKKLLTTTSTITSSPSPRISATAGRERKREPSNKSSNQSDNAKPKPSQTNERQGSKIES